MTRQSFSKCFERRSEIARIIAYGPSEDFRTATNPEGFNSLQYMPAHDAISTCAGTFVNVPDGSIKCAGT